MKYFSALPTKFGNIIHRFGRFLAGAMTLALYLGSSGNASAQTTLPRPTLAQPSNIFEQIIDKFNTAEPALFKIRNPQGRKIIDGGLQARIFTLEGSQNTPVPVADIDGCNVFLSVVLDVSVVGGTHAALPVLNYHWLGLTDSLNHIKAGRYFLVFEQRGPKSNEFRLKEGDEGAYFANGFVFTVSPSTGVSLEMVKKSYFDRRDQIGELRELISDVTRRVPCYTYRRLVGVVDFGPETIQASLESCEAASQEKFASLLEEAPTRSTLAE